MSSVTKSFRLSLKSARALEELVKAGRAPNQTALVEELIRRERLRFEMEREEAALRKEWEEAMDDTTFREDLEAVEEDFRAADAEVWGRW